MTTEIVAAQTFYCDIPRFFRKNLAPSLEMSIKSVVFFSDAQSGKASHLSC